MAPTLLAAAADADEDTREQGLLLLQLLAGSEKAEDARASLIALGAEGALKGVLESDMVKEGEGNPEHLPKVEALLKWLR